MFEELEEDEDALVLKARQGDQQAFAVLVQVRVQVSFLFWTYLFRLPST